MWLNIFTFCHIFLLILNVLTIVYFSYVYFGLSYSSLYCVFAFLSFCDCIVSDPRFYIFLECVPTRTERGCAWPSAYAVRSAARFTAQTSTCAVRASHVGILHSNSVLVQKIQPAEFRRRITLPKLAMTVRGRYVHYFSHNSNSLLRHLGYNFLLRSTLQLIFHA